MQQCKDILVVDDAAEIVRFLEEVLTEEGHGVRIAMMERVLS